MNDRIKTIREAYKAGLIAGNKIQFVIGSRSIEYDELADSYIVSLGIDGTKPVEAAEDARDWVDTALSESWDKPRQMYDRDILAAIITDRDACLKAEALREAADRLCASCRMVRMSCPGKGSCPERAAIIADDPKA
jgi:hypothetical protein